MAQNNSGTDTSKAPKLPKTSPAEGARIAHAVAVISGKGGVGKSFTSSYLAVALARKGYKVGILDADITGPSIPYAFHVCGPTYGENGLINPVLSKTGIQIMSSNLLLDNPEDPIVWRGAMISTLIEQFYAEVKWDVDYLIIDLAPGTGDISLTVFQKIKLSSAVLVTSPQSLVSMVVEKSAKMAEMLSVPLLSLVENMAYVKCPDCGKKIEIYGHTDTEIGRRHGIPVFDQIPFDASIASAMDTGSIEDLEVPYLDATVHAIIQQSIDQDNN
jgi:Mrp family chromosome partitioning ATPase